MDLGLAGKTVIVTGGSKGIGSGISEVFAEEGANLIVNYRSDKEGSEAFVKSLTDRFNCKAAAVQADVGYEADVRRIFDFAIEQYGQLDILINNAGKGITTLLQDVELEEWEQGLRDNMTGMFLMSREFARRVIPQKRRGWIVNILSKASLTTTTMGRAVYVSNKTGEMGLTKQLAVELTQHGIHVNGVMPGSVLSSRSLEARQRDPAAFEARARRSPLKRFGTPVELGQMVAFLASERAVLAVGSIVDMTGGMLLGF